MILSISHHLNHPKDSWRLGTETNTEIFLKEKVLIHLEMEFNPKTDVWIDEPFGVNRNPQRHKTGHNICFKKTGVTGKEDVM